MNRIGATTDHLERARDSGTWGHSGGEMSQLVPEHPAVKEKKCRRCDHVRVQINWPSCCESEDIP